MNRALAMQPGMNAKPATTSVSPSRFPRFIGYCFTEIRRAAITPAAIRNTLPPLKSAIGVEYGDQESFDFSGSAPRLYVDRNSRSWPFNSESFRQADAADVAARP